MNTPEQLSISKETLEKAIHVFEEKYQKKLMVKTHFETNLETESLLLDWLEKFSNLGREKPYFEYLCLYADKRTFLYGDIKATHENTQFSFGHSTTRENKRVYFSSLNYLFGFLFKQFKSEISEFKYEESFEPTEQVAEVETEESTDFINQVNLKIDKIAKYFLIVSLVIVAFCIIKWFKIF